MDNYIVRIYRRDVADLRKVAGLVELIEADEKKSFTSIDELNEILGTPADGPGRRKKMSLRKSERDPG